MKKVFFLIVALLIVTNADAQVSFSAKVAGGLPGYIGDVDETVSDKNHDSKFKAGFKIGAGVDYALFDNFSLQSGLFFSQKGAKYEGEESEGDGAPVVTTTGTYNPLYLEIPVLAAYKFRVTDHVKLSVSAGPYLAYGLGGKAKIEEAYDIIKGTVDANLFSKTEIKGEKISNTPFNRFDAGLAFGAGAEIGKILVSLNYDLGLSNIYTNKNNNEDDNKKYSLKNSGFWLGVGYKF
ncbi:hypothetical protein Barb6XT_00230 [Bacteroidales bacterium Barb6XT]|nr:hypothetical protein Barb6XT_00230 [Bacteroidales bacterium Barb6XT]